MEKDKFTIKKLIEKSTALKSKVKKLETKAEDFEDRIDALENP